MKWVSLLLLFVVSAPSLFCQSKVAANTRQAELQQALAIEEPGAQRQALEAFARKYPDAPELEQVYTALLQDAMQLNDDHGVLLYNEKLEALDPGDLAQRIKTINLLLLESDPANQHRAQEDAATFAKLVEAKAAEKPPEDMGETRWRLDIARLRSLAGLFQGTAAQALRQYPDAERFLVASLQQSQSEEAAEHLAEVDVAEAKIPQAVDAYALALALPGDTIAGRAQLRQTAGRLYRQLHGGTEAGFGDLILRKFDEVAARDADEQKLLASAPAGDARNAGAQKAGDFVLTTLDGAQHRLGDETGKVVVLDFWATWCGPCLVQHPLLERLEREFQKNHNVIFIAVNEDEDRGRVSPFLAEHRWGRSTWLDAGLGPFLGVDSLPTTLILDRSGAVVYRQEGFVPDTFESQLRAAVEHALGGSPSAQSSAQR